MAIKSNQPFSMKFETRRFNKWVNETTKGLEKGKTDFIVKIGANLISEIIDNTPVDTGRARAGWAAFADTHHVPYSISGPNVSSEAISEGKALSSFSIKETARKATLRITNSVAYIKPLEFGHSKQAPAGMVRLAMRAIQSGASNAAAVDVIRKQITAAVKKANATPQG